MLRAQAFEGLFTIVPILLVAVISIFLRARATRRRKQREDAAGGAPARSAPVQTAEGTHPSAAATRTAAAGPAPRSVSSREAAAREATARAPGPTRATQFPWQRETQQYPEAEQRTPASAAPISPQQLRRPQVTSRESYAYPPPLSLNDFKSQTAAMQPRSTPVPRPVVGPAAQGRMAVDRGSRLPDGTNRMAVPRETQNLRERMEARVRSDHRAVKAAPGARSSITARLERLPPLKRAVVWAEILGPPGGRQQ